jgi:F-type H+-transporting ATPase subunit epsilon
MREDERFRFSVISPQGTIYDGDTGSVTLPSSDGEITVLAGHMPLLAKLAEGEIVIRNADGDHTIVTGGGFLEVTREGAVVLSDYAVRAESIELAKALEKKRLAEEALVERTDLKEFTKAEKALRLSALELKVYEKMRKKRVV